MLSERTLTTTETTRPNVYEDEMNPLMPFQLDINNQPSETSSEVSSITMTGLTGFAVFTGLDLESELKDV